MQAVKTNRYIITVCPKIIILYLQHFMPVFMKGSINLLTFLMLNTIIPRVVYEINIEQKHVSEYK